MKKSVEEASFDGTVAASVKIIPAKRTASFDVRLSSAAPGSSRYNAAKMTAKVNTASVTFGASSDVPKTLEAIDAIIALAQAVRAELVEQGVTE